MKKKLESLVPFFSNTIITSITKSPKYSMFNHFGLQPFSVFTDNFNKFIHSLG